MEKISQSQTKIIIIALVVLSVLLLFWLFIYAPNRLRVEAIKSELLIAKAQIDGVEAIVGPRESVEESIQSLMERYEELNDRFPQKEEEALGMLSHLARRSNIELISIAPQPKKAFLDEDENEIEIEGRVCQSVFVSMEMRCHYRELIEYIQTMKKSLPAFLTIEKLSINKEGPGGPQLLVRLEIYLYLLA